MKKVKNFRFLGELLILICSVIWGFGFIVVKNSLDGVSVNTMIFARFGIAAVALSIIFIKRLVKDKGKSALHGVIIGFLLWAAYTVQTYGIQYTTPGKNAFLTALYVVFTPLFWCIIKRKKPTIINIICAVAAFVGIGFLTLDGSGFNLGLGEWLSAACGVIFAAEIVAMAIFTQKNDVYALTSYSFMSASVLGLISAVVTKEDIFGCFNSENIFSLLFMGLISTVCAILLQNLGQKYCTNAQVASIIMSLESVFGTLFGIIFGMDKLSVTFIIGTIIMFMATICCEADFNSIKIKLKTKFSAQVSKEG